ncbi:MAG: sugar ABC transporter ATP-binding protein [Clostridiales bacterium]|nr:sugar ABC transporter ATP-binding protein [Clostridiales bacterium]
MAEVLLQMRGIQKYFPGVHALDDCRFELRSGEVHALVGENGAGKSTMMKVLTGVYQRDAGEILIDGKPAEIHNTRDAQALGISIIHQELNLMKDLTVAENIFIGREPKRGVMLDKKKQNRMAQELLSSLSIDIPPTTGVGKLTVAKQQMVEIAKALSFENTRILIMDEPSAALTETEIGELFRFIRELKARGVGIVYISHRMGELGQISDRITVLRDGQYIGTVATDDVTVDDIIRMMVGRVIYEQPKEKSNVPPGAPVVLEARDLRSREVKGVSFELKKGEILGFAGLMGAGRTETARLIVGADRRYSGEIYVNGKRADIKSPSDAVQAGIGYLSEDRKRYGLCLPLSVADNVALATLEDFTGAVVVNDRKVRQVAHEYRERISIKAPTVDTKVVSLSGGNQQKVVVAKWLVRNCDILIFDEPTRGIDVGAKSEIYKLMHQLVGEGKSIIMISSEMPELLRMSDRILVMCEGEKTGELDIQEATQEKIMALAAPRI